MKTISILKQEAAFETLKVEAVKQSALVYTVLPRMSLFMGYLYAENYCLAHAEEEAIRALAAARLPTVKVSCFVFFNRTNATKTLLFHAEKNDLPVALIQDLMEKTVEALYDNGFILGYFEPENAERVRSALAKGTIVLEIKEKDSAPIPPAVGQADAGSNG